MEAVIITKQSAKEAFSHMPSAILISLYSISKYHEKYKFTKWVLEALEEKGFVKEDMKGIDTEFTAFYNMLLTQDDL